MTNHSPLVGQHGFRLTKAKRDVLELLAKYFCLRTSDIAQLLRSRSPNASDLRSVRRTLQILRSENYVHRVSFLAALSESWFPDFAHGLSDHGVKEAIRFGYATAATKTFDEHSHRTIDHELAISSFHIKLAESCKAQGLELFWRQIDLKKTVNPDALFAITDPRQPEGRNTTYHFLELEHSKLGCYRDGTSQLMRKLNAYHPYYDSHACLADWKDFRQFKLIVVLGTEEKQSNFLRDLTPAPCWLMTDILTR